MTTIEIVLISGSGLLNATAFIIYLRSALRSSVRPNRWSWLIWTFGASIEALTFQAVSANLLTAAVFWFSVAGCLAVTVLTWSASAWRWPSRIELLCAAFSVAGLTLALVFDQAWWGHLLVVMIIPISFAPTYLDTWRDYRLEDTASWRLWTFADLFALSYVLVRLQSPQEIPYAVIEALCHGAVWLTIVMARKRFKPMHSVLGAPGPAPDLDSALRVDTNHLGKAVFATRDFRSGDFIFQIRGELIPSYSMPQQYEGSSDRFMQVDHNLFIGPSGAADDLVNHSCDPNAGIRFTQYGMILVALRAIRSGEEISWDYSTTMFGIDWSMGCDCRSSICRKVVGGFATLPANRRAYYLDANVVAPFIERWANAQQQAGDEVQSTEDREEAFVYSQAS